MPRLDRQTFEELSSRTGFQVDVLEKAYRLAELLNEITRTDMKEDLVLKGGTAINFMFLELPRLSVDIDMDYIGSVEKDRMKSDRETIHGILNRVFGILNYTPKERTSYALHDYNLYYENSAGNRDRIELEINYLKRVPILTTLTREFEHPFDFENFHVLTLKTEELFGRKLTALIQRGTARDLYDIHRLLKTGLNYDEELMRKCFLFSLCLNRDPKGVDLTNLEQITYSDVRKSLLPLLRKGENVDLDAMKGEVQPLAQDFLTYRDEETEFMKLLFEEKDYRPEILFGDIEFNTDLPQHPGIEWRLRNI